MVGMGITSYHETLAAVAVLLLVATVPRANARALFAGSWRRGTKWYPTSRAFLPSTADGGALQDGTQEPPSFSSALAVDYDHDDVPPVCALVIMDGFCSYHSGYLARRARAIPGVAVVHVLSDYLRGYVVQQAQQEDDRQEAAQAQRMRIPRTPREAAAWKRRLAHTLLAGGGNGEEELPLAAVYCESDSGLADAERLRQLLEVEARDEPDCSEARRHKYLMLEACRAAGLPLPRQQLCTTLHEARAFAEQEFLLLRNSNSATAAAQQPQQVVCKPYRGAASDSVYLCRNLSHVDDAWQKITSTNVFGEADQHDSVLLQECLVGTEYAVDAVSRGGSHKVAAVWRYDKRPANGAPVCYFRTQLVDGDVDDNVTAVCDYATAALDALGVRCGVSHCEVIVGQPDDEHGSKKPQPRLVEINCRQHNMDFLPLVMACIGYNALDMALVAYLGSDEDWSEYPDLPALRGAHGSMVHLVNFAPSGSRLKQCHHLDELAELPSVFESEVYEHFRTPGNILEPTINIRSDAGWVQLIHPDPAVVQQDYEQIVAWMPTMFETTIEEADCDGAGAGDDKDIGDN